MNKLTLILVATLVAATTVGCGKKAASASKGSCEAAVAAGLKVLTPKITADIDPGKVQDALKLVGDAQLAACKDDKWPAEAIACMSAATDAVSMAACEPKMGSAMQSLAKVMGRIGPQLMGMMAPGKGPRAVDPSGPGAPDAPAPPSAPVPTTP